MRRWLAIGLSTALLFAGKVAGEQHSLSVRIEGGSENTQVRLQLRADDGAVVSERIALATRRELQLPVAGPGPWVVRAEATGFWAAPVEALSRTDSITLRLLPASSVELEVGAPRGERLPTEVGLRLRQWTSAQGAGAAVAEHELSCAVDSRGVARCAVPVGKWDLRVKFPGFVAHYFWERSFEVARSVRLGRLALARGGSILGRVTSDTGAIDPLTTRVEARPVGQKSGESARNTAELAKLTETVRPNSWGFFQIGPLSPGAFEIQATSSGLEPAAQVVEVKDDLDVEMREPFLLRPPLRLAVRVDPPVDPTGALWQTVLMGVRSGDLTVLAEGQSSLEGRWESKPLRSGRYVVRIRSRAGAAMAWREFDLTADLQEVVFELDLISVEGEVRIGDRPLAARLLFGGRSGQEEVEAESNLEGEFSLVLPRPGTWRVDLDGVAKPVRARDQEVEVHPSSATGVAEVSIALPNTHLEGRVRDEIGNAVAGAHVELTPLEKPSGFVGLSETDSMGRFEVEGQAPGSYALEASLGTRSSDRPEVLLVEGLEPPPIDLVLRERKHLRGRVVGPAGPIAGAYLLGWAITREGTLASTGAMVAHSGLEGWFELEDLPGTTAQIHLVVTALGYVLATRSVALGPIPEELVVSLISGGGRLELPASNPGLKKWSRVPLVLIDGLAVDLPFLQSWARAHETAVGDSRTLRIDAMPEGHYRYCEVSLDAAWLILTGAALPARDACTEGFLSAGGSLALGPATAQ